MNTPSSQSKIRIFSDPTLGNLSAAVKLPIQKKICWATQPLEQILDSEFLLCELGVEMLARKLAEDIAIIGYYYFGYCYS